MALLDDPTGVGAAPQPRLPGVNPAANFPSWFHEVRTFLALLLQSACVLLVDTSTGVSLVLHMQSRSFFSMFEHWF